MTYFLAVILLTYILTSAIIGAVIAWMQSGPDDPTDEEFWP